MKKTGNKICLILLLVIFSISACLTGCRKKPSDTPSPSSEIKTQGTSAQEKPSAENSSESTQVSSEESKKPSKTPSKGTETPTKKPETDAESTQAPSKKPETDAESTQAPSKKPETDAESTQAPTKTPPETESSASHGKKYTNKELRAFDNTSQGWGQGVHFNSLNQPEACLDYQKKYAAFEPFFIGDQGKNIWLTMDEGYENGYTAKILKTLREKNCKAIFFVTGQYVKENPKLIRQMIADGHIIGNHSWSHPSKGMPSLSIEEQISDITRLHNYVKEHFNYEMTLFRYPAGIFSKRSLAVLQNLGYRPLFWSYAYADWDPDKQPEPKQSLNKLIERLHPGSLYLLHAVSSTNTEILGDFIDQTRSKGYRFTTPN
ncbi:MAG: polysaccharide deacetylase family protein [Lachnospiraceae bacterium]|nr:polysaccharide deacetylase family protein [Lachnospiraceae bacterium]